MWHYGIVKVTHDDDTVTYQMAEIFRNNAGEPWGYSDADFTGYESASDVLESFKDMIKDAEYYPVFDPDEFAKPDFMPINLEETTPLDLDTLLNDTE